MWSLIGGFDQGQGASLYYMDYMASLQKVEKAAHGYCSYFCLSILDKYWKPNMNLEEGLALLQRVRGWVARVAPFASLA